MTTEKELQKLFGRNVRQLREAQGLTQDEFSRKAGINRSYLGGVERGQRTICMDNIAKIAYALGVTPDILFKCVYSADAIARIGHTACSTNRCQS